MKDMNMFSCILKSSMTLNKKTIFHYVRERKEKESHMIYDDPLALTFKPISTTTSHMVFSLAMLDFLFIIFLFLKFKNNNNNIQQPNTF